MIFLIGFSFGLYFEYSRTADVIKSYRDYEIESLDLRLQNYYYQIMDRDSCDSAIEQNFIFADRIYSKGLELEKYEEANQITADLALEKKKYVLLKTELWLNSILLKEKCNNPFDTVVYLYSGIPGNQATISEQKIISNVLKEVKQRKGNKIVLIPIAGDLDLKIVDLQRRVYNISTVPSIVINENIVLNGFHTREEIESYLK